MDIQARRGHFNSETSSVHDAREFVKMTLCTWGVAKARVQDVELIISELATNAVEASEQPFTVVLVRFEGQSVLAGVIDRSLLFPTISASDMQDPEHESGRGIGIMQELADQFGWCFLRNSAKKCVWCITR